MEIDSRKRIIITGAAGFIGSVLSGYYNRLGYESLILVDDFTRSEKERNHRDKKALQRIGRSQFAEQSAGLRADAVIHLGARTDTTEKDSRIFNELNLEYSKMIWHFATERQIPLIYASSAATYGRGEQGYSDDHARIPLLRPLNPYGRSKQDFDLWVLEQEKQPPFWAGLKFFNVYGPNEYHKGRMASVVFHAYRQIRESGKMKLFRSHRPDVADGMQMRDFIYVMDLVQVIDFLLREEVESGIYNLGSGRAQSFLDLVRAVFAALGQEPRIEFIDTPEDIRGSYQYFTEAKMDKLRKAGYTAGFRSLEEGVPEYVTQYLSTARIY
jgi:ADP-L-glycero-D-manno-heptose 6-epimerase